MTFSSLIFIFAFWPAALLLYGLVKPARARAVIMIIASLVFYAWGNPVYVILLILSVVFNYYIGCDPALTDRNSRSGKRIFICAVIVNLLILGFFNYYTPEDAFYGDQSAAAARTFIFYIQGDRMDRGCPLREDQLPVRIPLFCRVDHDVSDDFHGTDRPDAGHYPTDEASGLLSFQY